MKIYLIVGLVAAALYMVTHRANATLQQGGGTCNTTCWTDTIGRTHCVTTCN